jgi:hypothetical protein
MMAIRFSTSAGEIGLEEFLLRSEKKTKKLDKKLENKKTIFERINGRNI